MPLSPRYTPDDTNTQFDPFGLPLYPAAQDVVEEVEGLELPSVYVVTFRVQATSEEVRGWYKQALLEKGWTFSREYSSEFPHVLLTNYRAPLDEPVFEAGVIVSPLDEGNIHVKMFLRKYYAR